jgi:hypothetical protein
MMHYTPRYVDENGRPLYTERSLWEWLFGYKPKYQTAPTTADKKCDRVTAEGKPAAAK